MSGGGRAFTLEAQGILRELKTRVRVMPAFDPSKPLGRDIPVAQAWGIWDTGATNSVISHGLAANLKLKPTGKAKCQGVHGQEVVNTYLVNIGLPNEVGIAGLQVLEGGPGGADVLIGMDIIQRGDLALTNKDGKTVFSFSSPSMHRIDFTEQAKPSSVPETLPPKIKRNTKCPCGSGKKYKNCCGRNNAA